MDYVIENVTTRNSENQIHWTCKTSWNKGLSLTHFSNLNYTQSDKSSRKRAFFNEVQLKCKLSVCHELFNTIFRLRHVLWTLGQRFASNQTFNTRFWFYLLSWYTRYEQKFIEQKWLKISVWNDFARKKGLGTLRIGSTATVFYDESFNLWPLKFFIT